MGIQNKRLALGVAIIGGITLSASVKYVTVSELTNSNSPSYKCPNHRRPEKKLRRAKR